jgi:ankyrin repeat protein
MGLRKMQVAVGLGILLTTATWFIVQSLPGPLDVKDKYGRTELHRAAMSGASNKVAELIARGAHVNIPDEKGMTALHHATSHNNVTIAAILLSKGAKINARAKDGRTPLDMVVSPLPPVPRYLARPIRTSRLVLPVSSDAPAYGSKVYEQQQEIMRQQDEIANLQYELDRKRDDEREAEWSASVSQARDMVQFLLSHGARSGMRRDKSLRK